MSRIIKSSDPSGRGWLPFQRDALEELIIASDDPDLDAPRALSPQERAEMILQEAQDEAGRQIQLAYEEGMRRGEEAGRQAFDDSVGQCTDALKSAADALIQAREQFLSAIEPQVLELVRVIVKRILHREAATDGELIYRTVRAALQNLIERERIVLHVHPDDLESLNRHQIKLLDEFKGIEHLDIKPDETVARGGCAVETDLISVDARLDEQLERIFETMAD